MGWEAGGGGGSGEERAKECKEAWQRLCAERCEYKKLGKIYPINRRPSAPHTRPIREHGTHRLRASPDHASRGTSAGVCALGLVAPARCVLCSRLLSPSLLCPLACRVAPAVPACPFARAVLSGVCGRLLGSLALVACARCLPMHCLPRLSACRARSTCRVLGLAACFGACAAVVFWVASLP